MEEEQIKVCSIPLNLGKENVETLRKVVSRFSSCNSVRSTPSMPRDTHRQFWYILWLFITKLGHYFFGVWFFELTSNLRAVSLWIKYCTLKSK